MEKQSYEIFADVYLEDGGLNYSKFWDCKSELTKLKTNKEVNRNIVNIEDRKRFAYLIQWLEDFRLAMQLKCGENHEQ